MTLPSQSAADSAMLVDREDTKQEATIARIELLLQAKDDTSRFVALALLKAVLDNQPRDDDKKDDAEGAALPEEALLRLWEALPINFLDKLLRAGLKSSSSSSSSSSSQSTSTTPKGGDAAHMRDLAVAVLHTFAVHILPDDRKGDARLVGRIPLLVSCLLDSSTTTTTATTTTTSSSSSSSSATPTSTLILQTLATLVSRAPGAAAFNTGVDDLSPLIELAPEQPLVLDILLHAWLHGYLADRATTLLVADKIEWALRALAAAFKGTDGVTLLDFVAKLLRNAEAFAEQQHSPDLLPSDNQAWMHPVIGFVRRLAASRPTAAARAAYTHAAAALLRIYPYEASVLLWNDTYFRASAKRFTDTTTTTNTSDTPFAYLLISMLLVDLRASLPGLLAQLNSPAYPATAARLTSAFDILSAFIGYLVRALDADTVIDDENTTTTTTEMGPGMRLSLALSPDNLLRLRKSMAETLSVAAEHLRDRWDAAVAGAQGLHPDARAAATKKDGATAAAARFSSTLDDAGLPLAWDAAAAEIVVDRDPLVLAAVRALALWLREDDNKVLRREAAGLTDMLLELYESSSSPGSGSLDFRRPVLVALEGISALEDDNNNAAAAGGGGGGSGHDDDDAYERSATSILLEHGTWKILTKDLMAILQSRPIEVNAAAEAARGTEIVRVLLPIVENERPGTREEWMDIVTLVAAWAGPNDDDLDDGNGLFGEIADSIAECRVAVLQLVTALVANAHPSVCRRYTHSISAVIGLARRLRPTLAATHIGRPLSVSLLEALDDVRTTLESIRA